MEFMASNNDVVGFEDIDNVEENEDAQKEAITDAEMEDSAAQESPIFKLIQTFHKKMYGQ